MAAMAAAGQGDDRDFPVVEVDECAIVTSNRAEKYI